MCLHVLGCPEHDLTIFEKCNSIVLLKLMYYIYIEESFVVATTC